jgi:hypothetical protein
LNVLTTKNLNSKLNLKKSLTLVNQEKKNNQQIKSNNSKTILVFQDLLKALNLRKAQLNSDHVYQKKLKKNIDHDSSQIPIQLRSNLQNMILSGQNLKKNTRLDVTNFSSLKKKENKFAQEKDSKKYFNNLLNDPFKIISNEFSKQDKSLFENKVNETNINQENQLKTSDLIHKAKIQLNQLNTSFDALIKYQKSKSVNLSIDQLDFNARNIKFNQNIKAYVDVCCQNPKMVI